MSGGTRSYEMARRMVADDHEVHMVTSSRDNSGLKNGWFNTIEAGIHVHWYPVPYSNQMNHLQRIGAFLSFALASRKKAIELEGDVIFATSTPLTIALPAVPAARKRKIPMVFEVRDLWPEMPIAIGALRNPLLRFAAKKLERWAYKNAAVVVALSPGMKEGVVRTGFPANKVAVIPNSCDNAEFKYDSDAATAFRAERKWLGDKPLLVYAGTFGKVNGVGYMVELAKTLVSRGSDIRVLLVGDGAERPMVIEQARQAGVLNANLFFENGLPKQEMPALLSAATIASALFVDLPEMRPNSANKFFDALASGTPVLLNYGGWMHVLVQEHECGLAMWQKPVAEVASELEEKMHDPHWLEHAGYAARKLAVEYFDRDVLAEQLRLVLEAAVEGTHDKADQIAPGLYF